MPARSLFGVMLTIVLLSLSTANAQIGRVPVVRPTPFPTPPVTLHSNPLTPNLNNNLTTPNLNQGGSLSLPQTSPIPQTSNYSTSTWSSSTQSSTTSRNESPAVTASIPSQSELAANAPPPPPPAPLQLEDGSGGENDDEDEESGLPWWGWAAGILGGFWMIGFIADRLGL